MIDNYLAWFKDLDNSLHNRRGCWLLISSNVSEPLDMLEELIRDNADELRVLQRYNNDWGHPVLKQRIAARYGIRPENILLTNGCTNANYLTVMAHVRAGDSFICESPAYQPMWQSAAFVGANIKWLRRRPPYYAVDPDELEHLVDGRTTLVALTNLHNPSGAGLGEGQLREVASAVRRKNRRTRIMIDEVFRDFAFDRPACTVDPIFISTGSLSKVYGLNHLECGWVMADTKTIERISPLFMLAEGNGSRYLETLSAVVFACLDDFLVRSRDLVSQNRQTLRQAVEPFLLDGFLEGEIPEHGCIWFPRLGKMRHADPFCDHAVRRHRVHVVPGKFFGDRSRFRVGFGGDPQQFARAICHFTEAVASYQRSI